MARNGNGRGRRPAASEFADDQTGETGHEQSNAKARQQTIRDACKDIAALEAERKTISEKITEIRQTKIKGDLGMKLADFGAIYRLYKLEGEDRDAALDAIREGFKALGIGEQLDFVDAMGAAAQSPADAGGFPGTEATH